MRRAGPRPLGPALEAVAASVAPATTLARAQRAWPGVAGEVVARAAEPVSEHAGVLTVACESSVWAQEIELLAGDLVERLNAAIAGSDGPPPLRSLRVRTGRPPG
jgi:predicted nucleic acid-binding Zn ribbon protein